MAAFRFRLHAVLRHRESVERQKQRALALILAQMQQLQAELRDVETSMKQAEADLRDGRLVGSIDLAFLTAHRRFIASMQRKGAGLIQKMVLTQKQVDAARAELAEAAKQRRIIEKLRERQRDRWAAALNRRELEELDEIGTQLAQRDAAAADEIAGGP